MYYILENKDYTIKLFWTALAVAVNADDVRGSASRISSVQETKPSWVPWNKLQKSFQFDSV